ncbi:MAG: dual specificity protein phosphatase family protein [Chloroflexota bacterium]|nr:dual specificity protein phosphatase family protein [Chloroflexota bacterium]
MDGLFCTWIDEGRILASAAARDAGEVAHWREVGITLVINLHTVPDDPDLLAGAGIRGVHLPVRDFTAPSREVLDTAIAEIDLELECGGVVAVHCHAGLGRTGTVLASWLVSRGVPADEAIDRVRRARPGSIESAEQEAVVRAYAGKQPGP